MANQAGGEVIGVKSSDPGPHSGDMHNKLTEDLFGTAKDRTSDTALGSIATPLAETAAQIWSQANSDLRSTKNSEHSANPRILMRDNRAVLLASDRTKPDGDCQGDVEPNAQAEISVYIRSKASPAQLDAEVQRIQSGQDKFLSEAEFERQFGANPASVEAIKKFAAASGLHIGSLDTRSGRVTLDGSVQHMNAAFGTRLQNYKQPDGTVVRGREGALSVPTEMAQHIDGIFGLDERSTAKTHFRMGAPRTGLDAHTAEAKPVPMLPNEISSLYHFPDHTTGKGQQIAIIELGGNPNPDDYAQFYQAHGLKTPKFTQINVDGATSTPGDPNPANPELALDAEVIGAVAPDAAQVMILTKNSDKGFVDAIERAAFPQHGESENTAISISWGKPETDWTDQALVQMDAMFKKAFIRGIGVYAASGDDGAKDATPNFVADFPASDPFVTGTGGTQLIGRNGEISSETVWNKSRTGGSSGGGISERWPVPDYQKGITMPADANNNGKVGRGVPDVAGDADPRSGYTTRVDGKDMAMGGTSAVAPLFAALHARLSEGVGNGAPTMIGGLNPFFYRHANDGIFNDIIQGNNNGYEATKGWDATTGLGSIKDGNKMLALLKADLAATNPKK